MKPMTTGVGSRRRTFKRKMTNILKKKRQATVTSLGKMSLSQDSEMVEKKSISNGPKWASNSARIMQEKNNSIEEAVNPIKRRKTKTKKSKISFRTY